MQTVRLVPTRAPPGAENAFGVSEARRAGLGVGVGMVGMVGMRMRNAQTNRLRVWIHAVKAWGQRCAWVLCVRRDVPAHAFWKATAGDLGLLPPATDEAHLVTAADPIVVSQFISWFSRLAATSAPLMIDTAMIDTARIPALVPAVGTQEGAEMWDRYAACCRGAATSTPATASPDSVAPRQAGSEAAVEAVEKQIRSELKIPKPDSLLPQLVRLFERGPSS